MDYNVYTDEELIDMLRDGEEAVTDFLMNKYKNLVRGRAHSMFMLGAETEDLVQEGMIGLYKAVRDYDSGRDASFITFAELCVSRQMYTAIEAAGRLKHAALNYSTPIDNEEIEKEGGLNPEEEFLGKERRELLEKYLEEVLSPLEKQVFELKTIGMDYKEIAAILGKTPKSVDNAINRLKTKLKQFKG